jgi:hypothetical protein
MEWGGVGQKATTKKKGESKKILLGLKRFFDVSNSATAFHKNQDSAHK